MTLADTGWPDSMYVNTVENKVAMTRALKKCQSKGWIPQESKQSWRFNHIYEIRQDHFDIVRDVTLQRRVDAFIAYAEKKSFTRGGMTLKDTFLHDYFENLLLR